MVERIKDASEELSVWITWPIDGDEGQVLSAVSSAIFHKMREVKAYPARHSSITEDKDFDIPTNLAFPLPGGSYWRRWTTRAVPTLPFGINWDG